MCGLMTETIQAYLRLLRVDRAISAALAVLFAGLISRDLMGFQWEYLIACLVVLFSAFANFALNDYYDHENDRLNHREDRPLAQGDIPRRTAILFAVVSSAIALFLTLFLNPVLRLLILAGLPLSLSYHMGVKKIFILKNASIGLTNVGIILLGSLVTDSTIEPVILFYAVIGFFAGFSYEVMLDIADVEGDKVIGVETIPTRFGLRAATWLVSLMSLGGVFVNLLPFFVNVDPRLYGDTLFLVLLMAPLFSRIRITRSLLADQSRENIFRLKRRVFRNIQLGCLCFLTGMLL
jgi:4-hydroxybenzoate polyprenyltransferase